MRLLYIYAIKVSRALNWIRETNSKEMGEDHAFVFLISNTRWDQTIKSSGNLMDDDKEEQRRHSFVGTVNNPGRGL